MEGDDELFMVFVTQSDVTNSNNGFLDTNSTVENDDYLYMSYDPSDAGYTQTITYNPNNANNGYVVQGDNLQSTQPQIIAYDWNAATASTRFFLDGKEYTTAPRL